MFIYETSADPLNPKVSIAPLATPTFFSLRCPYACRTIITASPTPHHCFTHTIITASPTPSSLLHPHHHHCFTHIITASPTPHHCFTHTIITASPTPSSLLHPHHHHCFTHTIITASPTPHHCFTHTIITASPTSSSLLHPHLITASPTPHHCFTHMHPHHFSPTHTPSPHEGPHPCQHTFFTSLLGVLCLHTCEPVCGAAVSFLQLSTQAWESGCTLLPQYDRCAYLGGHHGQHCCPRLSGGGQDWPTCLPGKGGGCMCDVVCVCVCVCVCVRVCVCVYV